RRAALRLDTARTGRNTRCTGGNRCDGRTAACSRGRQGDELHEHQERDMTDAVVVGAGPAGVACALALQARGLRVVVAERRLRGTRGTPGETLPGRVRGALTALGLADVLDDWACTPIHTHRTRWGAALREHSLAADPHGHGWQVDRERFDELLRLRPAAPGVALRRAMR